MLTMTGFDRTYEVPARLRPGRLKMTAWDLAQPNLDPDLAPWAGRVLESVLLAAAAPADAALSCADCEDTGYYGEPDPDDPDILRVLVRGIGSDAGEGHEYLTADGSWQPWTAAGRTVELLDLDLAQDLASAVLSGASGLVRRYCSPLAFLPPGDVLVAAPPVAPAPPAPPAAPAAPAPGGADAADDWHVYAIVDDLDTGAILNLIRLKPGPVMERYDKGGAWVPDQPVLTNLMGVNPPPLVELSTDQVPGIVSQIDASTAAKGGKGGAGGAPAGAAPGAPGAPGAAPAPAAAAGHAPGGSLPPTTRPGQNNMDRNKMGKRNHPTRAIRHERTIRGERTMHAMKADSALTVSPNAKAEKLRQYWSSGKGGLKIRWGTPGAWKRCVTHLTKFMGLRAKGYCSNLNKRNTGHWPGSKLQASAAAALMAMSTSTEASLVASIQAGAWAGRGPTMAGALPDGIYQETDDDDAVSALTAGAFPVEPPDEWFADPKLASLTPLTVEPTGQVYGHLASFDMPHIGLPGKVRAPHNSSGYRYFNTGALRTAGGKTVTVGQLTSVGGHAPLSADAGSAVAHYDASDSAVADVHVGEDRHGIWFAGALRPDVTPERLRTFMASALSGDWRPINGHLELVAGLSVNVPGFPVARACVASGAVTALVAAGARQIALKQASLRADAAVLERLDATLARVDELENAFYEASAGEAEPVVEPVAAELTMTPAPEPVVDVIAPGSEPVAPAPPAEEVTAEPPPVTVETVAVPASVLRARELVAQRRQERRDRVHSRDDGAVTAAFKLLPWMHPETSDGTTVESGNTISISSKTDASVQVAKVLDVTARGLKVKYKEGGKVTYIPLADVATLVQVTAEPSKDDGPPPPDGTKAAANAAAPDADPKASVPAGTS